MNFNDFVDFYFAGELNQNHQISFWTEKINKYKNKKDVYNEKKIMKK